MKRKMSLEDELDVTRTSVAELTGWCITIALHELFGIGRERLNRVNNRQRMLAEQSMAIMMQPNERGMPSTEKARRMRAEALPESVPRECACDALKTDDIVVEDVEDSKELAAQRQHYHAQEVEFLRRAALAATGRKSCAKVLNVFDASAMDRKMAAVRDAAVGEAFRRRV